MKTPLIASLVLATALAGCGFGQSRLNPFNWFGPSRPEPTTLAPEGGYAEARGDFRVEAATITRLEIKPTQGGAIVSAAGLPPTQGWWDAELIAENDGYPVDGVMSYRFVLAEPQPGSPAASRVSTPESREVTVAAFISNARLASVSKVVVSGAGNARSVSR
ncbi:hypothetical protein [Paenirhodobacter sp. CAU 1674]|jgi:hypothetical protein|uniref:hypothetical protein n=1 Tax=Paenirhodobacter sp. CAU 1674 TaxID=3032596 RepID=UPI0023DC5DCC|nr:hypothetical protein [Paenirhodobacter sp. CAU 1674]MDF2143107.1 hypothetical protein [Paenirhodobacter sp. CAU 1674]